MNNTRHPADLAVPEAAAALRAGRLSAVALMAAHLERIAERNPRLHAFVALAPDAQDRAAEADRELASGRNTGPLMGIPFGVKDLIDVAGMPTRCGSFATDDSPAMSDAPAVARLRAAGAIPLGKLATYEFAMTGPSFDGPTPPARNPWHLSRITGGSSSGSASAVAGGLVRFALGSDTGGSVRSPAAFCGIVGLKPALGAVPVEGVCPLSPTLDHLGPLAATVAEAALVFAALTGVSATPPGTLMPVSGLRIGYTRDWFADDPATDPELLAHIDAALAAFKAAGAEVHRVTLPPYPEMERQGAVILRAEASALHRTRVRARPDRYGAQARQSLSAGDHYAPEAIASAHAFSRNLTRTIDAALDGLDILVTTTTLVPAPTLPPEGVEAAVWTPMRTLPFNMTGHPALSLPIGRVDGLPVAIQIVAAREATAALLSIAMAVETLFPPTLPSWPFRRS